MQIPKMNTLFNFIQKPMIIARLPTALLQNMWSYEVKPFSLLFIKKSIQLRIHISFMLFQPTNSITLQN